MSPFNGNQVRATAALVVAALIGCVAPAGAQQRPVSTSPSFTAPLSNTRPLAFGMGLEDATRALGARVRYVSGRPSDEIFMAFRQIGGSGFFPRNDRLYLQFRHGRLTGWKGDWGSRWMWR